MSRRQNAHTIERLVTLFWLSVDAGNPDECWTWLGYAEKGYGRYFDGQRMRGAHELALEWYSGEKRLPHLETCHSCNNPICCNPNHLRFDTRLSNVRDSIEAGTFKARAVITREDAVLIRERRAAGATGQSLAKDFGLSPATITAIVRGDRWPDAGGPIRTEHGNRKHGRYANK